MFSSVCRNFLPNSVDERQMKQITVGAIFGSPLKAIMHDVSRGKQSLRLLDFLSGCGKRLFRESVNKESHEEGWGLDICLQRKRGVTWIPSGWLHHWLRETLDIFLPVYCWWAEILGSPRILKNIPLPLKQGSGSAWDGFFCTCFMHCLPCIVTLKYFRK